MQSSQAAIDLIIACEVTSAEHYRRRLSRPTWPEEASGVTIGIGYDLGYQTRDGFVRDWSAHLSEDEIETLFPCVGIKGEAAEGLARRIAPEVIIPWEAAAAVFHDVTIPRFEAETITAFPGCEVLPGDCFGALVSLVYNRGGSMGKPGDDRRSEMRLIRKAIAAHDYGDVPALLREMKRLWPNARGLRERRHAEAALFDRGLGLETPEADTIPPVTPVSALRTGDSGDAVRRLQEALTAAGFRTAIDGVFGPDTCTAVRDFQHSVGLTADGIAGPRTLSSLNIA